MAHLIDGQQQVRPDEDLAATRGGQLQVVSRRRNGAVRDRAKAVSEAVRSAERSQYTRHGTGRNRVDAHDPRVRMGRANHYGVDLPIDEEIIAEAAVAGQ